MSSNSDQKYYSNTEDEPPIRCNNLQWQRQTNVYIKHFDNQMDESQLCELFAVYGTITSCKVSEYNLIKNLFCYSSRIEFQIEKDEFNRSRGFGFVNFLTPSMAEQVRKSFFQTISNIILIIYCRRSRI
jgi:RNA recognition motif-containing protein